MEQGEGDRPLNAREKRSFSGILVSIIVVSLLIAGVRLTNNSNDNSVMSEPVQSTNEKQYQEGVELIKQGNWDDAAVSLVQLKINKYKNAPELYDYARAQITYNKGDLGTAMYCIGGIEPGYPGEFANDIMHFKQRINAEYPAYEAKQKTDKIARDAEEKARAKTEGVRIGMTQEQARNSNWGNPRKINKTTGRYGVHEQWVYDGGYLYFDDGILTTIQN